MYEALYLVHDLSDAAVRQRARMLRTAGVGLTVAGFNRASDDPFPDVGAQVIDLGPTYPQRLVHRAGVTLKAWLANGALKRQLKARPDVIIARNLELLLIAARLRDQIAPSARLVYECLDIHSFMTTPAAHGRALRRVERRLLDQCDLVIVSSPDYQSRYFAPVQGWTGPTLLVENKFFPPPGSAPTERIIVPREAGPPWDIGWFGMIKCEEGLPILGSLMKARPGLVRLLMAGRPSEQVMRQIEALPPAPVTRYVGPYQAAQMAGLVGQTHFVWTIDFFFRDFNSEALLPNRLYSSCLFGSVPIVVGSTATGRWLQRHRAGIHLLDDCSDLVEVMSTMTASRYQEELARIAAIDPRALAWDDEGSRELAQALVAGPVMARPPMAVSWLQAEAAPAG